jgi:hypothetical protein
VILPFFITWLSLGAPNPGRGQSLDFSNGFGNAAGLTLNGSASIASGAANVVPDTYYSAGSMFSSSPVNIQNFATTFTILMTSSSTLADGMTFTIQGSSPTALGGTGSGLGYGPDLFGYTDPAFIPASVAIKFGDHLEAGDPSGNCTGLFTDGAAPLGGVDLTGTGVNLDSQQPIKVAMTYDGTDLAVDITNLDTGNSASQTYPVDIPSYVGGDMAFVGFTAGTGYYDSNESVLSWTLGPSAPSAVPEPTSFTMAAAACALAGVSAARRRRAR